MYNTVYQTAFILTLRGLLFLALPPDLQAQHIYIPDTILERQLSYAEAHLQAFRNDSAIAITRNLLKALKAKDQVNSPLGIRVQLAEASALERDEQNELALQRLLHVAQESKKKELWEEHAKGCLVMSLLYEKIGRKESSKHQLELAKADIDHYSLDRMYPYYVIRMSSWERLYGDNKKALAYAREALGAALKHQLILEEAISRMLLNMLLPESAITERMYHSKVAARLYQQLGDHTGRSYMLSAIASLHFQRNNFLQALVYNDSTIMEARQAIAEGHEKHVTIASNYRFRGKIYKQLGLLDSALTNIEKGYRMELDLKEKDIRDRVIEIDARYQNKYKQKQLDEQQLVIQLKNNQLHFSIIIVILILFVAIGLWIGYRKQRQTKRKLLAQNILIKQQANQLESLDAAKSRFFANISHELRTQLTLIAGPIRTLLKETDVPEKQKLLLKTASRSTRQLELMVNDILDLRKLEADKMPLNEEPTALLSFFQIHLAQFESLANWKDISYGYTLQIESELTANLDQEKCRQVIYNLLSNAFKFTPRTGKINVEVWDQDRQLHVKVTDTGIGIHPDDLPHVFNRFFQTSQKMRFSDGGTGIGLSICHEYTHLMNGSIWVESKPDCGSVFSISWPLAILEKGNLPIAPLQIKSIDDLYEVPTNMYVNTSGKFSSVPVTTKYPTVLVVEDNLGLQEYIGLLLSDHYHIVAAENGEVALQKIRSGITPIDLIVSDLMMPVMDGYELLGHLKASDAMRHIPVIMLTARAEQGDRLQALRIGVDDYMTKPFDEEELLVRIANLLQNQSVRQLEAFVENKGVILPPSLSDTDQLWLEKFEAYVRSNIANDTLTIPLLSDTFAMSESTLLRHLKRLTGLSPVQYIQEIRLNQARLLLESGTHDSISMVANKVGYGDARSFSRSFKKRFGKLPSHFI